MDGLDGTTSNGDGNCNGNYWNTESADDTEWHR